jgi:DNA-binding MarR family transcriptional regulator
MDISIAQRLFEAIKKFNKAQFKQHNIEGVKQSEMVLMFYVKKTTKPNTAGLKVSEISEMLGVTSPTVTQLLNSLEVKGWIERAVDLKDRRAVRIKLSDEGEKVIQKAIAVSEASFNELIHYLGEEESNQLADLLIKANQYYEQKDSYLTQSGDDQPC